MEKSVSFDASKVSSDTLSMLPYTSHEWDVRIYMWDHLLIVLTSKMSVIPSNQISLNFTSKGIGPF